MESKEVSLVIGAYNPNPQWFRNALKSTEGLFNEVIIVDDASDTDFESTIRHEANRGFYEARNTGCNLAKGPWIASLDDDDEFIPENVKELLEFIKTTDADIVHFPCELFGESSGIWGDKANLANILEANQIPSGSWFKKEVWDKVRFKIPEGDDWDFWARSKKHGFKFQYFPKPIYRHRVHSKSMSIGWVGEKFIQIRDKVRYNYIHEEIN